MLKDFMDKEQKMIHITVANSNRRIIMSMEKQTKDLHDGAIEKETKKKWFSVLNFLIAVVQFDWNWVSKQTFYKMCLLLLKTFLNTPWQLPLSSLKNPWMLLEFNFHGATQTLCVVSCNYQYMNKKPTIDFNLSGDQSLFETKKS